MQRTSLLIVDDEPLFGSALAFALDDCDTVVVGSGKDALARLAQSPFDVILVDLHLADMNGLELRNRVRASHPALISRLLFMTGGISASEEESIASLNTPLLEKPFDCNALRRLIARTVAGTSHA